MVLVTAALLLVSVLRLTHTWQVPLFPTQLLVLAFWWGGYAALVRYWGRRFLSPAIQVGLGGAVSVQVIWGALLISLPGTAPLSLALYWAWVLLAEVAQWTWWAQTVPEHGEQDLVGRSPLQAPASVVVPPTPQPGAHAPKQPTPSGEAVDAEERRLVPGDFPVESASPEANGSCSQPDREFPSPEAMLDPGVVQQWECRQEGGACRWCGWVRVFWPPGHRTTALRVAFCPPLPSAPEVQCEVVEGQPAAVEVVRKYTHGVHLRLRNQEAELRSSESQPGWSVVAVEAVAQGAVCHSRAA